MNNSKLDPQKLLKKIALLEERLDEALEKIHHFENHDHLTGLMHFSILKEHIKAAMQFDPESIFYIVVCGINNFEFVNNTLGYETGDVVLQHISFRLKNAIKKNAFCARKVGDEFIIVLLMPSLPMISKMVKKILAIIAQPIIIHEHTLYLTASAGISRYPTDSRDIDELVENAKFAFRHAKSLGINNYHYYTSRLGERLYLIKRLQKDLLHAFANDEFFLCYQPQIDLSTQRIIGVEAVLRWQHPELGCIFPDNFIGLLEKTEQIISMGNWVLEQACQQLKIWHKFDPDLRMAVNVSAKQLLSHRVKNENHLINCVSRVLQKTQLDSHFLELEITESLMISNDKMTYRNLLALKKLGVRIACDDFGSGYASFSRLKQLPLDTIKIDKSLVKDLNKNQIDRVIIQCIQMIAQQLNIELIAEGVKNLDEINLLQKLGCHLVQGFYFSKPVSAKKISKLIKKNLTHRLHHKNLK